MSIIDRKFLFDFVKIISYTKSTTPSKLYHITSYSTKRINYICWAVSSKATSHLICYVFGYSLRGHWIPTFIINFDTSVVFTKKIVPILEEFLQICSLWLFYLTIKSVSPLWFLVPIKIFWMIKENLLCPLNNHHNLFICGFICLYKDVDVVKLKVINWQMTANWMFIFVLVLFTLLLVFQVSTNVLISNHTFMILKARFTLIGFFYLLVLIFLMILRIILHLPWKSFEQINWLIIDSLFCSTKHILLV